MQTVFEMMMLICFGVSWPVSVLKSYRARTTTGKSLVFLLAIWAGYICGICSKLMADSLTYVFVMYVFNFCVVSTDVVLYFRNLRLDKAKKLSEN